MSVAISQFGAAFEELVARTTAGLLRVGTQSAPWRTAVVVGADEAVSFAWQAEEGETVTAARPGGEELTLRVQAWDPDTGLVLLKGAIPGSEILEWGQSPPRLGQLGLTVAVPSPEGAECRLDLVRCVSPEGDGAYFQTDGDSFPGFTGGPFVDPEGRVRGLLAASGRGNRSWYLPVQRAGNLLKELRENGTPHRGYLGVKTQALHTEEQTAVLVISVESDSPAEQAGLIAGDWIVALDGKAVAHPGELLRRLRGHRAGDTVMLQVHRAGEELELSVALGQET
jgi:S1-C subfamily serine protease